MMSRTRFLAVLLLLVLMAPLLTIAAPETSYQLERAQLRQELQYAEDAAALEAPLTAGQHSADAPYELRSRHFIFGMPRLVDDRHRTDTGAPGISVVVREGFVAAHFEEMQVPLWVCQRWTRSDMGRMGGADSLDRDWFDDPDLPAGLHAGTSYAGSKTSLDRGHLAKHAMNRAWGVDSSIYGCLMSNCAPQHLSINRSGAFRQLEDAVEGFIGLPEQVEMLWIISGTVYDDPSTPLGPASENDFARVARITSGFGVPHATYKIVGWFTPGGSFDARAYLFEQPHYLNEAGKLIFDIPDEQTTFCVPVRTIEARTGVDFFPRLKAEVADVVETNALGAF